MASTAPSQPSPNPQVAAPRPRVYLYGSDRPGASNGGAAFSGVSGAAIKH